MSGNLKAVCMPKTANFQEQLEKIQVISSWLSVGKKIL